MRKIIIDPGYSSVKFAVLNGKKAKVKRERTVLAQLPSWGVSFDTLGVGNNGKEGMEWQGKRWLVGPPALNGLQLQVGKKELFYIVLPLYLQKLEAAEKAEEVIVCVSLADWDVTKILQQEVLVQVHPALPAKTKFLPQGLGIWLQAGRPKDCIVLDIGFNTVDVLPFQNGKPQKSLAFSISGAGLVSFLSLARRDDPREIAKALENGDEEMEKILKQHYLTWLEEKLNVRQEWQEIKELPRMYGGGGAYFVEGKKVKKVKNPELANVQGIVVYFLKGGVKNEKDYATTKHPI
ncbi:MAG: hypothetical protein Q9M37_05930 [Desulfonauticus sp.]|nr:hypothetical protein [Desulfonauticus sp.]